jgi:hypothetical protein
MYDPASTHLTHGFELLVKSGEVHTTNVLSLVRGYIDGVDTRPRAIMCPFFGDFNMLAPIQIPVLGWCKKFIPGFIYQMNSAEIMEDIRMHIQVHWQSLSIDGSAFDSSQFRVLMELTDNRLWEMMRA